MTWNPPSRVRETIERYAIEMNVNAVYVYLLCEWLIYIIGSVDKKTGVSWRETLKDFPEIASHPVLESELLDICAELSQKQSVSKPSASAELTAIILNLISCRCK